MTVWQVPTMSNRMWRVVVRNYMVWRHLMYSSIATHIIEPTVFLLGFGYGVGAFIPEVDGASYMEFIAAGMLGYGVMNSASFEGLFSAFSRMHVQKTWLAILNAPMTLDDVLLGEWLWASIKGLMSGCAMLLLLLVLGVSHLPESIWVLPAMVLTALAFSGMALSINSLANNYDFFSYYFSLFITPMMLLSGTFFPVSELPEQLALISQVLPLYHAIGLFRPILNGVVPDAMALHMGVLFAYAAVGLYIAMVLTRKRLLS